MADDPETDDDAARSGIRRVELRGTGALTVIAGPEFGATFEVGSAEMIIGRGEDADIRCSGDGVSRHHAKLVRTATGSIKVVDLGSRNGTFVNDVRHKTAVLDDGDKLRIGPLVLFDFRYVQDYDRDTVDLAAGKSKGMSPEGSVVATLTNLGHVHLSGGHYADALKVFTRALANLEIRSKAPWRRMAQLLHGIGEAHLGLRDLSQAAISLQRAIHLLNDHRAPEGELVDPMFALARALAEADPERARSLAADAKEHIPEDEPDGAEKSERIEMWIERIDRG